MNLEEKTNELRAIFPNIQIFNIADDGNVRGSSLLLLGRYIPLAMADRIPNDVSTLMDICKCATILGATEVETRLTRDTESNRVEFLYYPSLQERLAQKLREEEERLFYTKKSLEAASKYKTLPSSGVNDIRISEIPSEARVIAKGDGGSVTLEDGTTWLPIMGDDGQVQKWILVFPA